MEIFGIVLSIPVAFVASMAYCALLYYGVRRVDLLCRILFAGGCVVLGAILLEGVLLLTLGALRSRALTGHIFYPIHFACFLLGSPALGQALLLRKRGPLLHWVLAGLLCTLLAFGLVLLQVGVSEALYGVDGTKGPHF